MQVLRVPCTLFAFFLILLTITKVRKHSAHAHQTVSRCAHSAQNDPVPNALNSSDRSRVKMCRKSESHCLSNTPSWYPNIHIPFRRDKQLLRFFSSLHLVSIWNSPLSSCGFGFRHGLDFNLGQGRAGTAKVGCFPCGGVLGVIV